MEDLCNQFPVLASSILNNLDDQNLANCKEVSRDLNQFLIKERVYWIRIITKYNNNWKQIINKVPVEALKELAVESERSYWIGIINKYNGKFQGHQESWEQVMDKTPITVVKQLAIEV